MTHNIKISQVTKIFWINVQDSEKIDCDLAMTFNLLKINVDKTKVIFANLSQNSAISATHPKKSLDDPCGTSLCFNFVIIEELKIIFQVDR